MDTKYNKLNESKIREVADKNDIVEVVSQYLTLKKAEVPTKDFVLFIMKNLRP